MDMLESGQASLKKKVQIYNRYSGSLEEEPVCGEWFLRLAYGTVLGRIFQRSLGSRPFVSRIAACYAKSRRSARRIIPFCEHYGMRTEENLLPVEQFATFNEFFCRQLKPSARTICGERDAIVAPADGRYLFCPDLSAQKKIFVKGRYISLHKLLRSTSLAEKFYDGCALIARLCPFDYHRFHFPCDGVPGAAHHISGSLHSVHPFALQHVTPFFRNKRYLTRMVTAFGEILIIEVGATFVGSVTQTYAAHRYAKKGNEKGFFSFGGSTLILLLERNMATPREDLQRWSDRGIEVYARMGDAMLWGKYG
jgi:phosphatidylserine decarboxylase